MIILPATLIGNIVRMKFIEGKRKMNANHDEVRNFIAELIENNILEIIFNFQ